MVNVAIKKIEEQQAKFTKKDKQYWVAEQLKDICRSAAEALDVIIYGGDCIVSPDGEIRIIDFNDWPSFAPCRNEAAPFIAKCVLNAIKNRLKTNNK